MRQPLFLHIFLFVLVVWGCSPSGPLTERDPGDYFDTPDEEAEEVDVEALEAFERLLIDHRSHLNDQFANLDHDMPEVFLRERSDPAMVDEFAGYRVQILSTRNRIQADALRDDFRVWAEDNIPEYEADAYIYFRQPYYRVRTGDFRNRNQANAFARFLKDRYPDAWVVYDRIDPNKLPESSFIQFGENQ